MSDWMNDHFLADEKAWAHRPLGSMITAALFGCDVAEDSLLDAPPTSKQWKRFTPEARDRYVEYLDQAVTRLREVRAALAARDWRICDGCGVQFVGVESQRYHSTACKQKAYRARQRLSQAFSKDDRVCGTCRGSGHVPIHVAAPSEAHKHPDIDTICPICGGSGRFDVASRQRDG